MKTMRITVLLVACGLILSAQAAPPGEDKANSSDSVSTSESLAGGASADEATTKGSQDQGSTKEVYTGTLINMQGRSVSTGFTLTLEGRTSDEQAQQYLQVLATQGQDGLLKAIRKNDLGF